MGVLVEATGFEPTTSWSRTKRATKLRYASIACRDLLQYIKGKGDLQAILRRFSKTEAYSSLFVLFSRAAGHNFLCGRFVKILAEILCMLYNVFDMAKFLSRSPEETRAWAEAYASTLAPGDVVLLEGEMGAGKTVIAQGIAKGLGVKEDVLSPTYAYVNSYAPMFHFDCYRIENERQAEELGFADYFDAGKICLVEWSENIASLLPAHCKKIAIRKTDETQREIEF